MLRLHGYFRSSAAFRVRIALNLKGLAAEHVPVDLVRNAQRGEAFTGLNAQQLVPVLEADGAVLTQSLAILEYLEETHPEPPLLPREPVARAHVRALAHAVACDIHPLNNLRVRRYLKRELGVDEAGGERWYRHWCESGLAAVDAMLAGAAPAGAGTGPGVAPAAFVSGERPGLAEAVIVPQVWNALSAGCTLADAPRVRALYERCMALPAFADAAPERQPDAPAA